MPLISGASNPIPGLAGGLGFAMFTSAGEEVWVILTSECLQKIGASSDGVDSFLKIRALIEGVASAKFDAEGAAPIGGMQNGAPILILSSEDIPDQD
jgi:hypothetical protein